MAKTKSPGKVLQSWVSPEFLAQVRERAALERRPVSELVRIAVEDRLSSRSGSGGITVDGGHEEPETAKSPPAADTEGEAA